MNIHNPTDYEKYQPIGDKVLLALPQEDVNQMVNDKGVLVPQNHALRKTPLRETVVTAIGPDCKQVQPGDTVLWNKGNAGQPFPFGGMDLYFLDEKYLICITKKAHCDAPLAPNDPRIAMLVGAPDEGSS